MLVRLGAMLASTMVAACAGVSGMTADEVAKLSNPQLCLMNERTPLGFIPLELERRKLDCAKEHRGILDLIAKEDTGLFLAKPDVPAGILKSEECRSVRLGRVRTPYVTETRTENTVRGTSDSRFHQHVVNTSGDTVYVLFSLSVTKPEERTAEKLVIVQPRSDTVVRFGTFTATVSKVTIDRCKAFAPAS
jgi:hypothetical protein